MTRMMITDTTISFGEINRVSFVLMLLVNN